MLNQLINQFKKLFEQSTTYGSELEKYIVSKHPTSVAEIDHWTRQFDKNNSQKGWPV